MIIFSMLEEIDRSTVPEDCTVKQEGCKQRVVLKADETKPCIAEVAVVGRKGRGRITQAAMQDYVID